MLQFQKKHNIIILICHKVKMSQIQNVKSQNVTFPNSQFQNILFHNDKFRNVKIQNVIFSKCYLLKMKNVQILRMVKFETTKNNYGIKLHHEGHNYYLHHQHKSGNLYSWQCANQPCKGKCKTGSKTDDDTFVSARLQRWADNFGEEIK